MKPLLLSDRTHVFFLAKERRKKKKRDGRSIGALWRKEREKKQKTTNRRLLGDFFFRSVLCVGLERLKKKA